MPDFVPMPDGEIHPQPLSDMNLVEGEESRHA
jgi:hypothetical protein